MKNIVKLASRINKANKQINFQLNKNSLPKEMRDKLPSLKGITIKFEDFDFE